MQSNADWEKGIYFTDMFFLVPTLPENKYKAVWRKMNYFQYVPEEDENVKAMQVIDSSVEKLHTKLTEIQGELQGIEKVFFEY